MTTFTLETKPATIKIGRFFALGLVALAMAACTGTETPTAESPESAQALAAAEKADGPQHGRGKPGMKHGMMDPARMIERLDANKDGKLAVSELPERMAGRMGDADADKDGFISADELKAHMKQKMEERAKKHFAKMDTNGDGALTAEEVGEKRWEHMKVADADGDAKVTASELQKAHEEGKLMPPRRHRGPGPGPGPDAHDDDVGGDEEE